MYKIFLFGQEGDKFRSLTARYGKHFTDFDRKRTYTIRDMKIGRNFELMAHKFYFIMNVYLKECSQNYCAINNT